MNLQLSSGTVVSGEKLVVCKTPENLFKLNSGQVIPENMLVTHPKDGSLRIKERILTLLPEPRLISFEQALEEMGRVPEEDTREQKYQREGNISLLWNSLSKLYSYEGGEGERNRVMHPAKVHKALTGLCLSGI